MIPMPDFLPTLILPLWRRLLTWLSAQLYARVLPPRHYLVQLAAQLDWAPLEAGCAAYHHTAGPGTAVTHPVARLLVRALVVKYLRNLSLRAWEEELRTNLVIKWFVGYGLFEPPPDHSTLERFELWGIAHQARRFFDEVLRQIDADFPAERLQPQIGDTYALRANAAQESLRTRLRHTGQRLLAALATADPAGHTALRAELAPAALCGAPDEVKEYRLTAEQRRGRLDTTAVAAAQCADRAASPLADPARQVVTTQCH
jgi:hypothetical protein